MLPFLWLLGLLPVSAVRERPDHCTAMVAGVKATADGATFVGQSVDSEGGPGDSLVFVPAADYPPGSLRAIYDQEKTTVQVGSIPQVPHTYAYTYGSYGIMNEHKLAFAESTCSGRIAAASLARNGTAVFSNKALTQVALERCKTARCAIALMGDLAVNHGGFYGEDVVVDTGSESLVVADVSEAWVFHILADPTGRSAIWAAQRVPDDKVAFVPNTFVIRAMNVSDAHNFMISPNAQSIAREYGWWDGQGDFDFSRAYSLGEYNSPHYSSRRMWRAYDMLAPSLKLDPALLITDTDAAYPFAVKPDQPLTAAAVFRIYRDYYQGTQFSLASDTLAAGPFNSPLRVAGADAEGQFPTGAWERPISIYRTSYTVLSVCPAVGHGVVWFAPHTAHAAPFSPAWTSAATIVARPYKVDATQSVDRESLFWAVSAVSNWAFGSMFSRAITDVRAAQDKWEAEVHQLAAALVTQPAADHDGILLECAKNVHSTWWNLFFHLMGKYNDGYVVTHDADGSVHSEAVGYPSWWLKAAHFEKGVDAPTAAFDDLKQRVAKATAQYEQIKANRTRHQVVPGLGFRAATEPVVV